MRLIFFLTAVATFSGWEPDRDFINAASLANVTEISAAKVALSGSRTSSGKRPGGKSIRG